MPAPPRLSVIVPVHDVAGFVGPAIDSLKAQDFTDWEAIVIDDGATDDSRAQALRAIAGDPRFRLIATGNAGLSAARNLGLDLARGDVLAFLDGDDRFAPGFLGRMLQEMEAAGTDWIACGLRYCPVGGGAGAEHSARHDRPRLEPAAGLQRLDLTDWRRVVQIFPSAWNKLYRRALIGDLRFDEGTWYEDHAFFWQLAAKSPVLAHLPQALYLQTVGRRGQITGDGGERVFEQFAVLERLRGLLPELTDRVGVQEAFDDLAVRLIFERGEVIADPDRRARFAARARDYLQGRGIAPDSPALPRASLFAPALRQECLASIVIPSDGALAPLRDSLHSLASQDFADFEILVVLDGQTPLAEVLPHLDPDPRLSLMTLGPGDAGGGAAERAAGARNRGLQAARGDFVVFLDAGDRLLPRALSIWLAEMIAHGGSQGADMGFSGFRIGAETGDRHGGVHDGAPFADTARHAGLSVEAALALHALPSAKIFRRAFLCDLGLAFAPHALQGWQFTLQAALAAADVRPLGGAEVVLGEGPGCRAFWQGAPSAEALIQALASVRAALPEVAATPALELRLLTRAIWEKAHFAQFADPVARQQFLARTGAAWRALARRAGQGGQAFDPYMQAEFRQGLLGPKEG